MLYAIYALFMQFLPTFLHSVLALLVRDQASFIKGCNGAALELGIRNYELGIAVRAMRDPYKPKMNTRMRAENGAFHTPASAEKGVEASALQTPSFTLQRKKQTAGAQSGA
ncbi:MAG: hypothetical protein IJU10_01035 [Clostridia bacterium]|nr:hypothetical protein [Clostridia bacterium]